MDVDSTLGLSGMPLNVLRSGEQGEWRRVGQRADQLVAMLFYDHVSMFLL